MDENIRYHIINSLKIYDIVYYQDKNAAMMYCPRCKINGYNKNKKKLIINFDKDVFNCWVCNYSGRISRLYKEFSAQFDKDIYKLLISYNDSTKQFKNGHNVNVDIKNVLFPLLYNDNTRCIIDYFYNKGITYDKVLKYHISYDANYNVYIPSINKNYEIEGYFIVDIVNNRKRYIGNYNSVFNKINFNLNHSDIYLVESPLDAIYLDVNNVIVLFGTKSKLLLDSEIFEYIYGSGKSNIIIKFDDDATDTANKLSKFLKMYMDRNIVVEPLVKVIK